MPPITRHQLKKTGLKTEPYSKENRPLDRRALLDLVSNDVSRFILSYILLFIYFKTIIEYYIV